MGLSFSVSQNIQRIAGTGQMLMETERIYHCSAYICDNERVVSFQPIEHELLSKWLPKQLLLEISVNILPLRKSFKCTERSIFLFRSQGGRTALGMILIFSIREDSGI